jgi:hypothetical protein
MVDESELQGDGDFESEDFDGDHSVEQESFDDLPDNIPVDVTHTSAVYENFKAEFGEAEAAMLQSKWGDRGLHNERIVREVVRAHPETDKLYSQYVDDSGAFSSKGLPDAIEFG